VACSWQTTRSSSTLATLLHVRHRTALHATHDGSHTRAAPWQAAHAEHGAPLSLPGSTISGTGGAGGAARRQERVAQAVSRRSRLPTATSSRLVQAHDRPPATQAVAAAATQQLNGKFTKKLRQPLRFEALAEVFEAKGWAHDIELLQGQEVDEGGRLVSLHGPPAWRLPGECTTSSDSMH
jgi:hypothetical protein